MGVKDGSKAADQILGLTLAQFCSMMRNQAETNGRSGKPALDIDASWLWYKFKNRSGGPLGNIATFVKFLAREGFAINVVCDADERDDSKRASIDRRVGREHARLMAVEAKAQIMRLSMKLRDGEYNTEAERVDMESRRNWLSKYSATDSNLEGGGGPPDDYYAQLRNNLQAREIGHRGGSIDVVKAVFQADFHIAHRIVGKLTDGVISNDTDYHFITGTAICITDFNFSSRNAGGRMDSITISSASRETIQRLAESVRMSVLVANDQYKPASVRILDDASPRLRCLFAVAMGCDSYVGGVPGLGISALNARFRAGDQVATCDDMLNWICADKLVSYYSQQTESRGVGVDRQLARILRESKEEAEQRTQQALASNPETPVPIREVLADLVGDVTSWREHAQCADAVGLAKDLGEEMHQSVSPIVAREAGLSVHPGRSVVPQELPMRLNRKRGRELGRELPSAADDSANDPVIILGVSDEDIKDCTGFDSLLSMLYFITVVCDCDADLMANTVTSLTWLEEWHLYFEMVWGRSCLRWSDARRKYGLSDRQLKDAFRKKLALAKQARDSWPALRTTVEMSGRGRLGCSSADGCALTNSAEVLLSAAVAADRSGNERAVNVAKRCYFLGKGIDPSHRLDIVDDIWQAWGFQANFMYAHIWPVA